MNELYRGVIAFIKCGLTGDIWPVPPDFPMEKLPDLARSHQIEALVYQGAAVCGADRHTPAMRQLFQMYGRALLISERQMGELKRVFGAFEQEGIEYMPLKGSVLKALYPKPELRAMGDADVLIRTEQYDRIRPVMERLGFQEGAETDHELVWKSSGLYLELHKRLIPSYNADYYRCFGDGWQLARPGTGCRRVMGPEDEFLYILTHFAKHYRDGGIGCRQAVDLWIYRRAHPELDEAFLEEKLRELGLRDFYGNVRAMLSAWFENGPWDEKSRFMTEFIFESGSWGRQENQTLSRGLRDTAAAGSRRKGRRRYIRDVLFPARDEMQALYPRLKKHPALTALYWPLRWGDVLLHRRDRIAARRREWKQLTAENIETYQEALNYVGLSFRFREEPEDRKDEEGNL